MRILLGALLALTSGAAPANASVVFRRYWRPETAPGEVPANARFLVTVGGVSLAKRPAGDWVLRSSEGDVPVFAEATHGDAYQEQLVLRPSRPLVAGVTYELVAPASYLDPGEPVRYTVNASLDRRAPRWTGEPVQIGAQDPEVCGRNVTIAVPAEEDGARLFARVSLSLTERRGTYRLGFAGVSLTLKGRPRTYLLPVRDGTIRIGFDEDCHGMVELERDRSYLAGLRLVDDAGQESSLRLVALGVNGVPAPVPVAAPGPAPAPAPSLAPRLLLFIALPFAIGYLTVALGLALSARRARRAPSGRRSGPTTTRS